MIRVNVNQAIPLKVLIGDGSTGLYVRAKVYDSAGTLVATVALPHVAEGMYASTTTIGVEGFYTAVYTVYTDAGFLSLATDYSKAQDLVYVGKSLPDELLNELVANHLVAGSVGEAVAIIRGLCQQNYRLDQTTFNSKGVMTAGRIRIFATQADTDSGVNPIATFNVTATPMAVPNDHLVSDYKVTK